MLKVFVLHSPLNLEPLGRFLRSNLQAMADNGTPLRVEVSDETPKRSNQHNRYYRALLKQCADEAWVEGKQFPPAAWAEFFKVKFLPPLDIPGGRVSAISTADLDRHEMLEYTSSIEVYMQQELGITLLDLAEPVGRGEMSKAIPKSQICEIYAQFIRKVYKQAHIEIPDQFYPKVEAKRVAEALMLRGCGIRMEGK